MVDRIIVGVISCSIMAQRHMKAVMDNKNAELRWICDIDEELLKETAENLGIERYTTNYKQILEDPEVDAVIIVTPDQTHKQIVLDAAAAGKHILCEKPLALTIADCREMVEASEKSDVKMMVGQICRYTPGFRLAKELIDRGEIGELFFVESEYAHDYSSLTDLSPWRLDPLRHGFVGGGCHAVDLVRWIAGDPEEVMAYSNHKMLPDWPTDDCTIAIMKFPGNVIGKVFCSTGCKRNYTMRSVFYGSKGTIITDNTSPEMTVFKEGFGNGESIIKDLPQTCTIPVKYPIDISNHNASGEFEEFADCILNDKPVKTSIYEGAKTIISSLAVIESARTGRPVKPNYEMKD